MKRNFFIQPVMPHSMLGAFDPNTASEIDDPTTGQAMFYIDAAGNVAHMVSGQWVPDAVTSPTIQQAVQTMGSGAVQQAAQGSDSYSGFLTNLINMVPQLMQYDAQRQLMQVNLQRAQQGKPPIDASQYTPGVQVGLTGDTGKLLMYGLGILGGAWVLSSLVGGRRR